WLYVHYRATQHRAPRHIQKAYLVTANSVGQDNLQTIATDGAFGADPAEIGLVGAGERNALIDAVRAAGPTHGDRLARLAGCRHHQPGTVIERGIGGQHLKGLAGHDPATALQLIADLVKPRFG